MSPCKYSSHRKVPLLLFISQKCHMVVFTLYIYIYIVFWRISVVAWRGLLENRAKHPRRTSLHVVHRPPQSVLREQMKKHACMWHAHASITAARPELLVLVLRVRCCRPARLALRTATASPASTRVWARWHGMNSHLLLLWFGSLITVKLVFLNLRFASKIYIYKYISCTYLYIYIVLQNIAQGCVCVCVVASLFGSKNCANSLRR